MGLPAIPVKRLKEYTRQIQGLLRGEDVLFNEGERERWIRLVHPDHDSFININDPIPIYLAANGPRALEAVGELADGWVTTLRTRTNLEADYARISRAAARSLRSTAKPYTVALSYGCVLREGESLTSERVLSRVGPSILPGLHAQWEASYGPGADLGMRPGAEMADAYNAYVQEYAETKGMPFDRLYLEVHRGHMVFLKPGEEQFVTHDAIARTLTGTGPEIIEKLETMEAAGIDNIAISVTDAQGARDLIQDFGREVISKRA
jgi:alkanesulfonate monooxygenase SsuD/methylene tetrahydromethanopterin reductase-like flavin-dependent oxidoreductase (luciferase family)